MEKQKTSPKTLSERINANPFNRVFAMILAGLSWCIVFAIMAIVTHPSFIFVVIVSIVATTLFALVINDMYGYKWN